jgi:hypothetical protein
MSTAEFPAPGAGAGVNAEMESLRATPVVFRNSRVLCFTMFVLSVLAGFLTGCMAIMVLATIFPLHSLNGSGLMNAFWWAMGSFALLSICVQSWSMGRAMGGYKIALDKNGVTFNIGTKKKPADLFLTWESISAIKRGRTGNARYFQIEANDRSFARFSTYMFMRPGKIARRIAERTGLEIQKVRGSVQPGRTD